MNAAGLYPDGSLTGMLSHVALPQMYLAQQTMEDRQLSDAAAETCLRQSLAPLLAGVRSGMRIGITVGSRGIDRLVLVLRVLCGMLADRGAAVFLVPCMGSHGVDARGRVRLLEGLGVTAETVPAEIVSDDEVVCLGSACNGQPVYVDRFLMECDGVIVLNRVKPHTAFHAPVESGLQKMMAVGMGKQKSAAVCHRGGFEGMYEHVTASARAILATGKILLGVALVENAFGHLCELHVLPAREIPAREPEILRRARDYMPSIPFSRADVLVVAEMGKDISGSGMDTNVIGRYPTAGLTGTFSADKLAVLSLTAASAGNFHGVGFADFISRRLFAAMDLEHTYPNGLTNKTVGPAKIPPVMPDDRCAIQAALLTCRRSDEAEPEMILIKNTHDLKTFYVTKSLISKALRPLTVSPVPAALQFDGEGTLSNLW